MLLSLLQTPSDWFTNWFHGWQWPAVVLVAYVVGRISAKLEARTLKAEKQLSDLATRHMPSVHTMLAEIKILLSTKGK